MKKWILIVDDHKEITDLLATYLLQNGFDPIIAHDGEEALVKAHTYPCTLILLDIMMPKKDGYTVLQTLRQTSNVPIIMITAKGEEGDRVMGLNYGADDYIVKPFSPKEVIARIQAVLRRIEPVTSKKTHLLTYQNLTLNLETYEAYLNEEPLILTRKEMDLLWVLASNPEKVFSRNHLLDHIWGADYYGDMRTVDTHMKRLRAKLQLKEDNPWFIETIWGVGYAFKTY